MHKRIYLKPANFISSAYHAIVFVSVFVCVFASVRESICGCVFVCVCMCCDYVHHWRVVRWT